MNKATKWRLDLAHQVGTVYAVNPKVRVVILAGSAARDIAARHSDIEIDVFGTSQLHS